MENSENFAESLNNLTEEESQKLTQFKDLVGFEQIKCLQILRANDWNLEVALDLALDGAYNEDQTIYHQPSNETNSNNQLRNRHTAPPVDTSSTPENANVNGENNVPSRSTDDSTETPGLHIVLWNATSWLFKLPFIIVINTLNTFYDFFATLIRPALNYDSTGTVDRFINEFEEKYGTSHPEFFRGTYSQLLDKGKRDIRFILMYLHSPSHRDTDRFCSNVIATQRFSDFISSENVIFWSCSVYYPEGYKVFQSLKASSYPFLALVGLKNHKMVVMKKFEGYYELEPFLMGLKSAINNNEFSLIAARLDKEERNMSTLIRAQQDAAFEESLRVDQEKERLRKEAEDKKVREERLQKEKEEEDSRRQEKIAEMKRLLLSEIPDESDHENSIRIMFKLPSGKRLERRFLKNDPVKYLYYFVFCNEETLFNFKIRTNFPTRDLPGYSPSPEANLNSSEMNVLLENCDIGNNIVLFVHDLDS